MGISIRRYFPAKGTAGLARNLVKGYSRDPCPPPMINPKTAFIFMLDNLFLPVPMVILIMQQP
jgi:hypothetical protein